MSSQSTYDKVEQGTAVRLDRSPNNLRFVGTDGLAVCLGVHVRVRTAQGDSRFVAHMDCTEDPKGPKDPLYAKIVADVRGWMEARLGPFDANVHLELATFSGGTFDSTKAMHAGVRAWSGQDLRMTGWLNFQAPYGEGGPSPVPNRALGKTLGKGQWPCTFPAGNVKLSISSRRVRK